jgi:protein-tyrosine phosphatase
MSHVLESLAELRTIAGVWDLGGHPAACGARVRTGLVFRAGFPGNTDDADLKTLVETLGIRLFVDLRTAEELDPLRTTHDETLLRRYSTPIAGQSPEFLRLDRPSHADYAAQYVRMLPAAATAMASLIQTIAVAHELPLVFGCSFGKDRTGVLAAVLLAALGVDEDAIAAAHIAVGNRLLAHLESWPDDYLELATAKGVARDELRRRFRTGASTIGSFFEGLRCRYQDVAAYLASIGVTSTTLDEFRARLLTRSWS